MKPLKFILSPDSFKGSLSSPEVCFAMKSGINKIFPDAKIINIPLADGGEGTLVAIISSVNGKIVNCKVKNPVGKIINSQYGIIEDEKIAVIEMAAASGLNLIPQKLQNPLYTTTYGTGQLIKNALENGYRKFIISIGGSATTDGGAGMAQALGVDFFDKNGEIISEPMTGDLMGKCSDISTENLHPAVKDSDFTIASDVNNLLFGKNGAVHVYASQKGASKNDLPILENNMRHFYKLVENKLGVNVKNISGAGASGGLGAGLMVFLGAKIQSGIEIVLDIVKFDEKVKDTDYIITGEGKLDIQTVSGKTISGILRIANENNIPVIAIAGIVEDEEGLLSKMNLEKIFSICNSKINVKEAIKNASKLVTKRMEEVCEYIKRKENNE
ncbi:MAG: glycerate kinase [Candidatus Marinimicrobia bacterium]|nr:glycerate kinase [Candidatus Neomarinimicrobiota bacterium]